ncbi:MAG: RelA/SpoT family protein [bacterium]|nr:RelA/SpoT family protein [bacterium]
MIEKLLKKINAQKTGERDLIARAFDFAKKAHEGQRREDGEPYITHPVAVAGILADLKLDGPAIAACLMHDVLEDTKITEEEMEKEFGKEVTFLVKGVTKLAGLTYQEEPGIKAKQNLKAQSLRKMFFAMAEDIRVILIKLADRYHNMSTLRTCSPEKRKRISLETLEIYAPIAERLGMGQIKGDLEDMAFAHAYPEEYKLLLSKIKDKYADRQNYLEKVKPIVMKNLSENKIKVLDAHARAKHYYSLYKKLQKVSDLDRIHDLVALRIILPDISSCYEALGIIHKNYKPLPGLIKDYLAMPKLNGYRSIHATVFAEEGRILEIQLRTPEMHEHAENGIAAHWSYSESNKNKLHTADIKEAQWIAQLKNWLKASDNQELYQSLRTNFFNDRVFVLTPKGEVKDLPEGSTPLDFAYAVHTDLGHSTKGAKVNGRMVSFDYQLKNGQIVEIIKGKVKKPSRDWLGLVKSSEARRRIQSWFNANPKSS